MIDTIIKYYKASQTILGINERNLTYTLPENPKEARKIADSKLKAKRILATAGIPVPPTYAIIRTKAAQDVFNWDSLPSSFVLKPNKGFGGEGIIIVYGERKRKNPEDERIWINSEGKNITQSFLYAHVSSILEGNFSLKNVPDKAVFEERLKNISELKPYLYKGVPDIRVIVYNMVPVMAELRLPTQESNGKANLHAGGVGVGIDIASGITTIAIQHDRVIEQHPDTKMILSGFTIPYWDKILEMAIKAQQITGLGYIGADIALDKVLGPVMLEINARPGLAIQIANDDGLKDRVRRVRRLKVKNVKRGIRIAKELFGGEVEEEVEIMLGKKLIGLNVPIKLTGKEGKKENVEAKVDTGATYSSIDKELARKLGFEDAINYFESFEVSKPLDYEDAKKFYESNREKIRNEHPDIVDIDIIKSSTGTTIRPRISLEMSFEDMNKRADFTIIERKNLKFPALIGVKDLSPFIIDISKK